MEGLLFWCIMLSQIWWMFVALRTWWASSNSWTQVMDKSPCRVWWTFRLATAMSFFTYIFKCGILCILQRYIAVSNTAHDSKMINICTKCDNSGSLKRVPWLWSTVQRQYVWHVWPYHDSLCPATSGRLMFRFQKANLWSIAGRVPGIMLEDVGGLWQKRRLILQPFFRQG